MTGLLDRDATTATGTDIRGGHSRRRYLVAGSVALVVIAALVCWLLLFSSVFAAKKVRVAGVRGADRAAVLGAAAVDPATPLLRLDTGAIERRVARLAFVASARVSTSFPSTILITVTARVGVGYVKAADGAYWLVDKSGVQFRLLTHVPAGLPLFSLPTGAQAVATGAAVATVAASLPASLLAQVASIQAIDPSAITVLLRDAKVVHWGTSADSEQKAAVLPTLLTQAASTYDVSDPDQVFVH